MTTLASFLRRPLVGCTLFVALSGCMPSPVTDPDPTPDPSVVLPEVLPLFAWEPCPLFSEGDGPDAECATLDTPLRHVEPNGVTTPFFVKRYRPPGGTGARAVWLLQGGPGASGYVFEKLSELLGGRFPDVDYYMPDHRGTGRSARLGCSQEDAASEEGLTITPTEWPACRAELATNLGDTLTAFTTTNAANDVGVALAAMQRDRPEQPVFVFGISYGTYWAHRYLQLFPAQAQGVILDSIAAPGLSLLRQDEDTNAAAEAFFHACGADALCHSKLGDDPWQTAVALMDKLKAGHCPDIAVPEAPTHVLLRRAMGSLLMDPGLRTVILALVYRADRCETGDIAALRRFMPLLTQAPPPSLDAELWSWVLTNNVLFSEFNEEPAPTAAELEAIREAAVASRDVTTIFEANLDWPRYPADAFVGAFATTSTPMLMLSGGLDAATLQSKSRALQPHFTGPHQTWVEFPTAGHTTLSSTPFVDEIGERRSCATRLVMAFMAAPDDELDLGCVAEVEPLDFALGNADINRALFGTTDAWE